MRLRHSDCQPAHARRTRTRELLNVMDESIDFAHRSPRDLWINNGIEEFTEAAVLSTTYSQGLGSLPSSRLPIAATLCLT